MADNDLTIKINVDDRDAQSRMRDFDRAVDSVGSTAQKTDAALSDYERTVKNLVASKQAATTATDAFGKGLTAVDQAVHGNISGMEQLASTVGGAVPEAFAVAAGGAAAFVAVLGAVAVASYELASKAAEVGGRLNDLSETTGITVPALSKLSYAADVAGTNVHTLSNAVFMMQKNMEESPDKFAQGLHRIGLEFAAFKALSPDEQLLTIAEHLKATADPLERNAAGFETMGRQFRELAPALYKLNEAMEQTAGLTPWTDEQAKQAEEFEMAVKKLHLETDQLTVSVGRELIPVMQSFVTELERTKAEGELIVYLFTHGYHDAILNLAAAFDVLRGSIPKLPDVTGDATKGADAYWQQFKRGATYVDPSIAGKAMDAADQKAALRDLEEAHRLLAAAAKKAADELKRELDFWREYNSVGANVLDTIYKMDGATVEGIKFDLQRGMTVEMVAKAYGVYKEQVIAVQKEEKFLESVTSATTKAFKDRIAVIPDLSDRTRQFRFELEGLTTDGLIPNAAAFDDLGRAELANKVYADQWTASEHALANQLAHTIGLMPDLGNQAKANMGQTVVETHQVQDAVHDLGVTFEHLGRQIGGAVGESITQMGLFIKKFAEAQDAADKLAAAIQAGVAFAGAFTTPGSRGSNIATYAGQGAAIGTAIYPGIGTAIGAGAGALVGAFKVPEDEKAARDQFNAFKQSTAALFDATASGQLRMEAGADAWSKMIIQVREAYLATGHTSAEAMQVLADATLHTRQDVEKLPEDLAKINEILRQQAQDQSDLSAAMTKYKFTIEEMGPAFQRQELTKQALDLENSFRLLVGAGADAHLVIDRMGDDINAFIHTALKTGTEVPAEMKPMLEQMVAMGKLTDENGNAITDLGASGIKWSETMTQGFDRIVTALDKVLKALGWVDDAVTNLPTDHPIHIPIVPVWQELPQDLPGGYPTLPPGVETVAGMANGGPVYAAAGARLLQFTPRGTDTVPAMLTPGERVLSVSQNRAFESFLAGDDIGSREARFPPPAPSSKGADSRTITAGPVTVNIYPVITSEDAKDQDRVIGIIENNLRDNGRLYRAVQTIAKRAVA